MQQERLTEKPAETASEKEELLKALGKGLESLPAFERGLVAMHFGAGLSQEEIGRTLALTQQAVSFRIKKALNLLRTSLAQGGFAAATPFAGDEILSAALCTGQPVPAGLRDRVMDHLSGAGVGQNVVRLAPRRALAAKSSAGPVLVIGAIAIAAAAGGAALLLAGRPAPTPVAAQQSAPSSPAVTTPPIAPNPAPAPATDGGWQPVALQPQVTMVTADGASDFSLDEGKDGQWSARVLPDGTEIAQAKPGLPRPNFITLGPVLSLPREWSGVLDYEKSEPNGVAAFSLSGSDITEHRRDRKQGTAAGLALAKHKASKGAIRFRIVAWRDSEGLHGISLRYLEGGHTGVYTTNGEVSAKERPATELALGFATDTALTIRQIRTRALPVEWTPDKDPEVDKSISGYRKKKSTMIQVVPK